MRHGHLAYIHIVGDNRTIYELFYQFKLVQLLKHNFNLFNKQTIVVIIHFITIYE